MDTKMTSASKISAKTIIICIVACVLLIALSGGAGYMIGARPDATPEETPDTTPDTPEQTQPAGYAANPAYEYMVASAAWQMSAEAHALMMQGFYLAG